MKQRLFIGSRQIVNVRMEAIQFLWRYLGRIYKNLRTTEEGSDGNKRIAFLPIEFEVQFHTETISVTVSVESMIIAPTSGEQFGQWCFKRLRCLAHFSPHNLNCQAQRCYSHTQLFLSS